MALQKLESHRKRKRNSFFGTYVVVGLEVVLGEADDDGGFAHGLVSEENSLEFQVLNVGLGHSSLIINFTKGWLPSSRPDS